MKNPFMENLDSKEAQLEAVRKNGNRIQYIHNPDKDVQLEAVKQNCESIKYIIDLDEEVYEYYLANK